MKLTCPRCQSPAKVVSLDTEPDEPPEQAVRCKRCRWQMPMPADIEAQMEERPRLPL